MRQITLYIHDNSPLYNLSNSDTGKVLKHLIGEKTELTEELKKVSEGLKEKRKPPTKEEKELRAKCKTIFMEHYKSLVGSEYYWTPKDAVQLIELTNKIKFKVKERFGEQQLSNDKIQLGFETILKSITDKWLLSNFSIPNINSKFNEIFTQAKNAAAESGSIKNLRSQPINS